MKICMTKCKVYALHLSGYTPAEIAQELAMSVDMVHYCVIFVELDWKNNFVV